MDRKLPEQAHEGSWSSGGGSFGAAIDKTRQLHVYVNKALECFDRAANNALGSHERGGAVRQVDDYLDAIIRWANAAKDDLRETTYGP
jgi:hypothetical protein